MATKIIIKNSAVEGKVPDGTAIDAAELAINLKDQKLYSKDADGNVFELGNTNINNGGTDDKPDGPEIGDLYFDTDLEILLVWNGTDWEQVILGGDSVWVKDGNNIRPADPLNDVQIGGTAADPKISLNADRHWLVYLHDLLLTGDDSGYLLLAKTLQVELREGWRY